jgi:peptidoglycan/xylan/chitin deacetylase (PgdA/CDA1 family)
MARAGIEFGGHTRTHPVLSRIDSSEELESEIAGCRTRIQQELQSPVLHFCYPNGQPEDMNADVLRVTRETGYTSAVSTIWGLNKTGTDVFMLRRLGVNPDVSRGWFERTLAGVGVQ